MAREKKSSQVDECLSKELERYNTTDHEYDDEMLELSTLIWLASYIGIDSVDKTVLNDIIERATKLDIKPETIEKFL